MDYRGKKKMIHAWLSDYDHILEQISETSVFQMAEEYSKFSNLDRNRQKRLRRRFLIGILVTIALIGGFIGWSRYQQDNLPKSLGSEKYQLKGFQYQIQPDGTAHIYSFYGTIPAKLEVPETLNGAQVTEISADAFRNQHYLRSIVLPEGVTTIGDDAFYRCERLTSVDLPESIQTIGKSAFSWCERLSSIRIPQGTTDIGESAFRYCSSLTALEIPEGISGIHAFTFFHCDHLENVVLPERISFIDKGAFHGCSALTAINIPGEVREISESAFSGCSGLKEISLPEGLETIGEECFAFCTSLQNIHLPEGLKEIGTEAFRGCYSLEQVTISQSVSRLEICSFMDCDVLTLTIPPTVEELECRETTNENSFTAICFSVVRESKADLWLQDWLNDLIKKGWENDIRIEYYDLTSESTSSG